MASNSDRGPKFLLAIDKREQSEKAFKFYMDNLFQPDHRIILVNVAELPSSFDEANRYGLDHDDILQHWVDGERTAKELFSKYGELIKNKGGTVVKQHADNSMKPGHVVVDIATKEKVNTVVMGTRGMGTVSRTLLGSVSDHVLHHAHCTVVIYKEEIDSRE